MIEIRETLVYANWFARLRDPIAKRRIDIRLRRLSLGNPGDRKSVGEGILALRLDHGPGYRIYYVQRGAILIVLLAGGDKTSQHRDIQLARELAQNL